MATDGIPPEEQAELDRLGNAVLRELEGATVNACISVLSAVAAHVCVGYDHPQEAGLEFIREFLEMLDDGINRIPAESIITIPETN